MTKASNGNKAFSRISTTASYYWDDYEECEKIWSGDGGVAECGCSVQTPYWVIQIYRIITVIL